MNEGDERCGKCFWSVPSKHGPDKVECNWDIHHPILPVSLNVTKTYMLATIDGSHCPCFVDKS